MLESLNNKLKENINCELTIEELKVLYESNDATLMGYINIRDKYSDLCKIYGEKFIACTPDEITEDTICYIGDLTIYDKLPTYNLRFIFGNLDYAFDKVNNLENLERIYGDADFNNLKSAEGLENLSCIAGSAGFNNLKSSEGLNSLEIITNDANFNTLKNAENLDSLKHIGGSANFYALQRAKGLENLEFIGKDAQFYQLEYIKANELNNLRTIGESACFQMAEEIDGLKNLNTIGIDAYFKNLISGKGLNNLEFIGKDAHFESLKNAIIIKNLREIGKDANFNSLNSALGLENLLSIGGNAHFDSLSNTKYLDSLEFIGGDAWFDSLSSVYDLNLEINGNGYFSYLVKGAIFKSSISINGDTIFQEKNNLKISDLILFSIIFNNSAKGFKLLDDIDSDILTYNSKIVDDNNLFKKLFNRKYRIIEKEVSGGSILSNKYVLYREDSKKIIGLCKGLCFNGKKIQIDSRIFGVQVINNLKFITTSEKKHYISELSKCEDNESAIKVIYAAMDAELEQCNNIINYLNSNRQNNRIKAYSGKHRKIQNNRRYTSENPEFSEISSFDDIYKYYKKLPSNINNKGSKDKKRQDFILYKDYLNELSHLIESIKDYNLDLEELAECYDMEKIFLILLKKLYDMMYNSIVNEGCYDPKFKQLFDSIIKCFKTIDKYKKDNNSYNLYICVNEKKDEFLDYDTLKSSMINLMVQFPNYDYEKMLDIFPEESIPFIPFSSDMAIPLKIKRNKNSSSSNSNNEGGFERILSLRYLLSKNPYKIMKVDNIEFSQNSFKNYTGFVYKIKDRFVTIFEKCPMMVMEDNELVYDEGKNNATYAMNIDTKYQSVEEKIKSTALSKTQVIISNRDKNDKKIADRFYHKKFDTWKKKVDSMIGSDSIQLTGGSKINIKTSNNNSKTLKKNK